MIQTSITSNAWLDAPAASAYQAARAAGCPAGITSAGRTPAEQASLWARYMRDLATGRKPPRQAAPPWSTRAHHVDGTALDLPGDVNDVSTPRGWMTKYGAAYGWHANRVPGEPWHFEYIAGPATPAPTPLTPEPSEEEDPMYTLVSFGDSSEMGLWNPRTNAYLKLQTMTGVGYCREALPLRETKYATKAEFDAWRTTLAPVLKD